MTANRPKLNSNPVWKSIARWLMIMTLAGTVSMSLYPYLAPVGMGQLPAMAEGRATWVIHEFWGLGAHFAMSACSEKAIHLYKIFFALLMFIFAGRESVHLAKTAWRRFRSALREHKPLTLAVVRFALALGLCAGPIHYVLDTLDTGSISSLSDGA